MRVRGSIAGCVLFGFVAAGGCGGSDGGNGSGANGGVGGSSGNAGSGADGGVTGGTSGGGTSSGGTSSGGTSSGGSAGMDGSAGTGGCRITPCQRAQTYACGDCVDNDGDGKVDMEDPDCLGPCHNAENTYYGSIPGQGGPACTQDCYFDKDSGSGSGDVDGGGNDDCNWNHRCDPKSVGPKYPPEGDAACEFDIETNTPGTSDGCGRVPESTGQSPGMYDRQSAACLNFCKPLTPNGCDCFGCCELPAGGGKFVWLGSEVNGEGSCTKADVNNPDKCRPCTPVAGCMNTCERCELCLGKDTLPADCSPQPPDGGSAGAAGTSGTGGSAGTGTCAQVCSAGVQKCGNGCGSCAAGYFCLTGCCIPVPE